MHFRHYANTVYRNFATLDVSEELVDDLTEAPEEQETLKTHYYTGYAKQEGATPIERVLEKSMTEVIQGHIDAKFSPDTWYTTRYSDGTWPVLYTAESEETALREALFHMMRFYKEELAHGPVHVTRRAIRLQVTAERCLDLCQHPPLDKAALTSRDFSGYPYCQQLAKEAIAQGAQLFRAPSARDEHGTTVPLFDRSAITQDHRHLKYLRCILHAGGQATVTGIIEEIPKKYIVQSID